MPIVTVRRARLWLESVEDQVSAEVGRVVQTSNSDLMARGVAFNLLQMAKRIGPQCKAACYLLSTALDYPEEERMMQ